jgi:peroxiredoxin
MNNDNTPFENEYNLLKPGDKIPDFTWVDEYGKTFSSEILKGKSTLIILFSDDCRHCRDNFAFLEKNLFQKNLSGLNIMAIGRGCDYVQLDDYLGKYPLSIRLTADPEKKIYSKFAEKAVPRIYLFNPEGILLLSIRGFRPVEIEIILKIIHP